MVSYGFYQRRCLMSAFLGPIHYWLYNKISLQEALVQNILKASAENHWVDGLAQKIDDAYGAPDDRPLEAIIDQSNIHGWLQGRIAQSESRLALAVTTLLSENPALVASLEQTAYDFGEAHAVPEDCGAGEAYKFLTDSLIDGMPCDRVNALLESDSTQAVWQQTRCVHSVYWDEVGGDIAVYYSLRRNIIKGMLSKGGFEFTSTDDSINTIRRQ